LATTFFLGKCDSFLLLCCWDFFFGVVTVFLLVGFQFQAFHKGKCVGTVVCKMGDHRNSTFRGYIAMLVVIKPYRGRGIGNGFFFFSYWDFVHSFRLCWIIYVNPGLVFNVL